MGWPVTPFWPGAEGRGSRGANAPPHLPKILLTLSIISTYVPVAHPHQLIKGKFATLCYYFLFLSLWFKVFI